MNEGIFEREPGIRKETVELQQSPEQVFDSDRDKAEAEATQLQRILFRIEFLHERRGGVELHIEKSLIEQERSVHAKSIKVVWCGSHEEKGTMLQLDPIVEGHGPESGVFGYKGRYGVAVRKDNSFVFSTKTKPTTLEQLYGCLKGTDLRVKPTVQRWAIGKDELSALGGENQYTLYMGLGFVLMDERWMYIGFHEAGHLPHEDNENVAWTTGKRNHAKLYKGNRSLQQSTSERRNSGLFGLLEKPLSGRGLTVGMIERYGITSHYLAGNASLPEQWKKPQSKRGLTPGEVMRVFAGKIEGAQFSYDKFFGRY